MLERVLNWGLIIRQVFLLYRLGLVLARLCPRHCRFFFAPFDLSPVRGLRRTILHNQWSDALSTLGVE